MTVAELRRLLAVMPDEDKVVFAGPLLSGMRWNVRTVSRYRRTDKDQWTVVIEA